MSELQENIVFENISDEINPQELKSGLYRLIQNHNPLITEMYERSEFVRQNDSRLMTEYIQKKSFDADLYEQILLSITMTEGIISWGIQEVNGRLKAGFAKTDFNSKEIHRNYIEQQTNKYSIFAEDPTNAKLNAIAALNRFPNKPPREYIDFFSTHAIFCVTKSLVGHIVVNDILQPLSQTYSTDESLELLLKNQPFTLKQLFNPETYLKDLQESEL